MAISFDARGREIPDPRPMEITPGLAAPESLESMMRRLIRNHVSQLAVDQGEESFEEANDFDIEDEDFDDPLTKYEEMGLEPINGAESEDGAGSDRDPGPAEPAGLRAGESGRTAGPSDGETMPVDNSAGDDEVASLPAAPRKDRKSVVSDPGRPAVDRPGKRAAG